MAGNFILQRFTALIRYLHCPFWACDGFYLLLLLVAFSPVIPALAGIVVIVLLVLLVAQILCIYCGNYFYSFPKGLLK